MAHYSMPHLPKLRTEDRLVTYALIGKMGSSLINLLIEHFFHDDKSNTLGSPTSDMGKT